MSVTLGKRKRRADLKNQKDPKNDSDDDATARALFQRAFEAKFKPLPIEVKAITHDESEDEDESSNENDDDLDEEWDGLSNNSDEIEVIQIEAPSTTDEQMIALEKKAFMSSKPPSSVQASKMNKATSIGKKDADADEGNEANNLKHDLALQRLLKESHLLDASSFDSTSSTDPSGKSRLKALDLRLQALGAKTSHLEQAKMPLAHRKGMQAKSAEKEQKRRVEAKENGVILERFAKGGGGAGATKGVGGGNERKREKSIAGPTVGSFRGATLKVTSKDVRSIQSEGGRGERGGRGRGRGGKRGGRGGKR